MTLQQSAYEHLYALGQQVGAYDALTTDLRDNVLHVAYLGGGRVEQVTCVPRGDDGGRLWFWDAQRRPIAPAGSPDAPLEIARRLR
jgi:hypothetical protein